MFQRPQGRGDGFTSGHADLTIKLDGDSRPVEIKLDLGVSDQGTNSSGKLRATMKLHDYDEPVSISAPA
ncbi:hypothetical protein [Actinoplanes sp. RD1]|uniref:hypothetical protein n=1 Tax=Actinoplanes sp. RD1 TaxID=3064538 RepID=UPI0027407D53|nr:hypothetical protein [Actinoplanes sp. RD1]